MFTNIAQLHLVVRTALVPSKEKLYKCSLTVTMIVNYIFW